jgi:hypothetical protein
MPPVGFEPTIPVFDLVKTVHALDRAATVIGDSVTRRVLFFYFLPSLLLCALVPVVHLFSVLLHCSIFDWAISYSSLPSIYY